VDKAGALAADGEPKKPVLILTRATGSSWPIHFTANSAATHRVAIAAGHKTIRSTERTTTRSLRMGIWVTVSFTFTLTHLRVRKRKRKHCNGKEEGRHGGLPLHGIVIWEGGGRVC